tara:strand:+ start:24143 stop:25732 length:1590 start_codon:yes stop_codon:yes gene_type:complete
MYNCSKSAKQLLKLLKVRHTNTYLEDNILSHQDYPSLLSISDVLTKYNIENVAVKIAKDNFDELPTPCIVQVSKDGSGLFYTLNKITLTTVSYFDDKNKLLESTKQEFLKIWTGVCLLAETNVNSKEIDIDKKLASKNFFKSLTGVIIILLTFWIANSFSMSDLLGNYTLTTYTVIYSILKLIGLTAGVFLLWFDIDQFNPTLQNFCTGGKKINCNAVLKSNYATLFDGNLSLGLLGFSYFFATFFCLALSNFSSSAMTLLAILSIILLPVIAISFYYQAAVVKQWCKFCVIIQVVLVAEITISFFGGFYKNHFAFETLFICITLFIMPIVIWNLIKPLIIHQKESYVFKRGLKRIKANPIVLESLLAKSNKIMHSTDGLGITISNEGAKYNVIKVCNPYCGPCAKAHPFLEDLVNAGKINLQMLFTARADGIDLKAKPVSHFLAIDSQNDKKLTQKALDDWYNSEKKDYNLFANKYPVNGELEKQNDKINRMREWCDAEKITQTPTIFINGYKIPSEYSIEDLKDVLF